MPLLSLPGPPPLASASQAGLISTGTQTLAGNKTFTGSITASNFSGSITGTNTGDLTLTAVGATPSANGASLSGQALTLQPADATHPGVVSTTTQTLAGAKTISVANSADVWSNGLQAINSQTSNNGTTTYVIASYGEVDVSGNTNLTGVRGLDGEVYTSGTGNVVNAFGAMGYVENSGSGIITRAAALWAADTRNLGAGSITESIGLLVNKQADSATNYAIKYDAVLNTDTPGTNPTQSFCVTGSGSVGVGTLAPTQKLDVVGNLKFSLALMPGGTAGTTGQILTSAGAGVAPTWTAAATGNVTGTGSSGAVAFWTGTSSISEDPTQLFWNSGTNRLGIGNVAPTVALDVTGAILASSTVTGSNLSGTNTGDLTLTAVGATPSANGASLSGQALTLQPADATNPGVVSTTTQTLAGAKTLSGALSLTLASGNSLVVDSTTLVVDATNNRVGVGTASPAQALDVVGNLRFSQALMPGGSAGVSGQVLASGGSGVVPTWVPSGNLGWYDVTTYGAVGDGVTDDGPAIQAAINVFNAGIDGSGNKTTDGASGVIYFPAPPVAYRICSTLEYRGTHGCSLQFIGENQAAAQSQGAYLFWDGPVAHSNHGFPYISGSQYTIVGTVVTKDSNAYELVSISGAGIALGRSGTGPTGTGTGIVDGNCVWDYKSTKAAYVPGVTTSRLMGDAANWVTGTYYSRLGTVVCNASGLLYELITTGLSAAQPTTTAADITDGTCHWKYLGNKHDSEMVRWRSGANSSLRNLHIDGRNKCGRIFADILWHNNALAWTGIGAHHRTVENCHLYFCAPYGACISVGIEGLGVGGYDQPFSLYDDVKLNGYSDPDFVDGFGASWSGDGWRFYQGANITNVIIRNGHCFQTDCAVSAVRGDINSLFVDSLALSGIGYYAFNFGGNTVATIRGCEQEPQNTIGGSFLQTANTCTVTCESNRITVGSLLHTTGWGAGAFAAGTMTKANKNTATVTVVKAGHGLCVGHSITVAVNAADDDGVDEFTNGNYFVTATTPNTFTYEDANIGTGGTAYSNGVAATITHVRNNQWVKTIQGNVTLTANKFTCVNYTNGSSAYGTDPGTLQIGGTGGGGGLVSSGNWYEGCSGDFIPLYDGTQPVTGGNQLLGAGLNAAWARTQSLNIVSMNDLGGPQNAVTSYKPIQHRLPTHARIMPGSAGTTYGTDNAYTGYATQVYGESRSSLWRVVVPYTAFRTDPNAGYAQIASTTSKISAFELPAGAKIKSVIVKVTTPFVCSTDTITIQAGASPFVDLGENNTGLLLPQRIDAIATTVAAGGVSKATGGGKVVTVTSVAHGLKAGNYITVVIDPADSDATELSSGTFQVTSTATADTFTYTDHTSTAGAYVNTQNATFARAVPTMYGLLDSDLGVCLSSLGGQAGGFFSPYMAVSNTSLSLTLTTSATNIGNANPVLGLTAGSLTLYVEVFCLD